MSRGPTITLTHSVALKIHARPTYGRATYRSLYIITSVIVATPSQNCQNTLLQNRIIRYRTVLRPSLHNCPEFSVTELSRAVRYTTVNSPSSQNCPQPFVTELSRELRYRTVQGPLSQHYFGDVHSSVMYGVFRIAASVATPPEVTPQTLRN